MIVLNWTTFARSFSIAASLASLHFWNIDPTWIKQTASCFSILHSRSLAYAWSPTSFALSLSIATFLDLALLKRRSHDFFSDSLLLYMFSKSSQINGVPISALGFAFQLIQVLWRLSTWSWASYRRAHVRQTDSWEGCKRHIGVRYSREHSLGSTSCGQGPNNKTLH